MIRFRPRSRSRSVKAPTPETAIKNTIMGGLKALGIPVYRINSGATTIPATGNTARKFLRFSFLGCTDLIALLPDGLTLWIEVKVPGKKLSDRYKI